MSGSLQAVYMNQRSFIPPIPYWIATLTGASSSDNAQKVAIDSSENIYFLGSTNISGDGTLELAKYNPAGVLQWQKSLGTSGTSVNGYGIKIDSSDNIYVSGQSSISAGGYSSLLAKYDTTGTLQWQRILGLTSYNTFGNGLSVDASGNIYVGGYSNSNGTAWFQLHKYNSSGTLQWQKQLGSGSGSTVGYGVAVDSSSNVFLSGYTTVYGPTHFEFAKYNSGGSLSWQARIYDPSYAYGNGAAVDASGNSYICGFTSTKSFVLVKYNSSGSIVWSTNLNGASYGAAYAIAVDSSGFIYVCGYFILSGTKTSFQIAKYSSGGSIQWQRSLTSSSADCVAYGITVNNSNSFYVCGYTQSNAQDFLMAKLPSDGSLTGTYTLNGVSYTYAASSLTDGTPGFTDSFSSLTDSTGGLSSTTSTLTNSAGTLTSYTTSL